MNKLTPRTSTDRPWVITNERLVLAGVFGAITILLGYVPVLGFIPVPNIAGSATTLHIPSIIAGITGGPIVGIFTGLIFGLTSFLHSNNALFKDPLIAFVPRLFIGLVSWFVYASLTRVSRDLAAGTAAVLGSLTNTILVLAMIVIRGYQPLNAMMFVTVPSLLPQIIVEAIGAALISIALARAFTIIQGRFTRAPETKSREELPY